MSHCKENASKQEDFVCAAAVGSLGLFGNSVLQLIACKLLADRAGLQLVLPRPWADKYGAYFPAVAELERIDAEEAYALPLVADRVVLSHPGWRTWALRHDTGRQLAARLLHGDSSSRAAAAASAAVAVPTTAAGVDAAAATSAADAAAAAKAGRRSPGKGGLGDAAGESVEGAEGGAGAGEGGGPPAGVQELAIPGGSSCEAKLSGRQLRAHFPQVSGADLDAHPAQLAARLRGSGLWGWFQFPTARLRPHRAAVRQLLALRGEVRAELEGA
ncbi:hypothetical protein Agub_g4509, partial [Astrephomene gubernaculifera]